MTAKYWQKGEVLDYKASAAVKNGEVVSLGTRIGVAGEDIAAGETGHLHVVGVFEMEKATGAMNMGAAVYYDEAAKKITTVASTGESDASYEMRYEDENIWLTQKMMAALYDVGLPTINEHIKKIYSDGELTEEATIRKFRIVQTEGVRQVNREVTHYNLQLIIAVGFKVNNQRAVQFRKWAGQIVKDHTIQGWTMDVERLKKGHMFTDEYFERQLQQIREIRLSERKFYQKVTDLYATAFDYDKNAKTTRQFFQTVQNKMHFAVHRHTAAELIYERADAAKEHMGLTTWKNAPDGRILKSDVSIAKNYLQEKEMYRQSVRV